MITTMVNQKRGLTDSVSCQVAFGELVFAMRMPYIVFIDVNTR